MSLGRTHLDNIFRFHHPASNEHILGHLKLLNWKRVTIGKLEVKF